MKKVFKKGLTIFSMFTVVLSQAGVFVPSAVAVGSEKELKATSVDKYTICHATESETNPWNRLNVPWSSVSGHFDNNGTPVSGHEDDVFLGLDNENVLQCPTIDPEPYCGDGNLDDGEQCDDSNTENGDGCDSQCVIEVDQDPTPECEPGGIEFDVDMYVMGENCTPPSSEWWYQFTDTENINLAEAGNYTVMAEVHRSGLDETAYGQDNEVFTLNVNDGPDGPVVVDNNEAQTILIQNAGDFDFNSGDNTVRMDTAWTCDTQDTNVRNSVEVKKLCLYKNYVDPDPICGDGNLDDGEQCDDGNTEDGDGCDSQCVVEEDPDTYTVKASKIVCDSEEDLPNWGAGNVVGMIDADTAADFVAQNENCRLQPDWEFQYGINASDPGKDFLGHANDGWVDFDTATGESSMAEVVIPATDSNTLKFREVLIDGYVPFSYHNSEGSGPGSDVSAEFYCNDDVLNYDNYDYIKNPVLGETYYCVAFNVVEEPDEPAPWCSVLYGMLEDYYDESSNAYGVYNDVIDLNDDKKINLSDVGLLAQMYNEADDTECYKQFEDPEDEFHFSCVDYKTMGWCGGLAKGITDYYGAKLGDYNYYSMFDLNDDNVIDLSDWGIVGQLAGQNDQVTCYNHLVPPLPEMDCGVSEPYCGDGNLDDGEQCDDGNTENGDGCDAQCVVEELEEECSLENSLIKNGSFENPEVTNNTLWQKFSSVANWVIEKISDNSNTTLEIHRGWSGNEAAEGWQYSELDGDHSTRILQNVTTEVGAEYKLFWSFAPRHNIGAEQNNLGVKVDGSQVATNGPVAGSAPLSQEEWLKDNYTFKATGENTEIAFEDIGPSDSFGTFLDDVRLCKIADPEPNTSICGVKFNDKIQDAKQVEGEMNLAGWTINLYEKNSCQEGDQWADEVIEYNPGPNVPADRSNPAQALGVAENNDTINFVSLGLNGEIVLKFDNLIENQAGDDIKVYETSYGNPNCAAYPEYIHVYASQDGNSWTDLGAPKCQENDPTFDLGSLPWAQYLKLVDETTDTPDGFDLDGVAALNCLNRSESPIDTTVTTENGYCFNELEAGHYMVCEEMQEGWTNSTPLCQQVELEEEDSVLVDFGNYEYSDPFDPAPWCSILHGMFKDYYNESSNAYGVYNDVIDLNDDKEVNLIDVGILGQMYNEADDAECYKQFEDPEDEFHFSCVDYETMGWCGGLFKGIEDYYGTELGDYNYYTYFDLNDDDKINLSDLGIIGQLIGQNDQVTCYNHLVPPLPEMDCGGSEPYCGDGIVNNGEQCDGDEPQVCTTPDGYAGTQSCNMPVVSATQTQSSIDQPLYCVWNECVTDEYCGDGIVNGNEECDGSDNCSESCTITEAGPFCGDGNLDEGEQCDDGNTEDGDGCDSQCVSEENPEPFCGDGIVNNGEQCDDGNTNSGDGCSASCTNEGGGGGGTTFRINHQSIDVGTTTADVFWTTNRDSLTWIVYGTSTDYGMEYKNDSYARDHTNTLTDLEACTTYHYREYGQRSYGSRIQTSDMTFKTACEGPQPEVLGEKICSYDCGDIDYDLYIVNHVDGSHRYMNTEFTQIEDLGNGKKLVKFEDKGLDWDYNDVVVEVDESNCTNPTFKLVSISAAWDHEVHAKIFYRGNFQENVKLWPNDRTSVGKTVELENFFNDDMCLVEEIVPEVLGEKICAERPSGSNGPDADTIGKLSFPTNTLIREECSTTVYVIKNVLKHRITSPSVLKAYFEGKRIYNVSQDVLDYYPDGKPITLGQGGQNPSVAGVKVYGDGSLLRSSEGKIYLIKGTFKLYLNSLEELQSYQGQTIYNVSDEVLNNYSTIYE